MKAELDYYEKKTIATAENVRKLSRILSKIDGPAQTSMSVGIRASQPASEPITKTFIRYFDEHSKKYYLYDPVNKLSRWEEPPKEPSTHIEISHNESESEVVKSVLSKLVDTVSSDVMTSNREISAIKSSVNNIWRRYFDYGSNRWYYHNLDTNTTQWERPQEFVEVDQDLIVNAQTPIAQEQHIPRPYSSARSGAEDYRCIATFNQRSGKFCAGTLGPDEDALNYWKKVRI
jgi:hypothetical protein